jgi:hypothetical protein
MELLALLMSSVHLDSAFIKAPSEIEIPFLMAYVWLVLPSIRFVSGAKTLNKKTGVCT